MAAYEAYEFGPFVLEVSERRLAKKGRIITLPPKAFDLLTVLVRQAGQLVTKRELLLIEIARLLTFHVVPPDCAAHNSGRRDHSARA